MAKIQLQNASVIKEDNQLLNAMYQNSTTIEYQNESGYLSRVHWMYYV